MERIKLYRHTIRNSELLQDGTEFVWYDQSDWSSVENMLPITRGNAKVVKTEEKDVFLEAPKELDEH